MSDLILSCRLAVTVKRIVSLLAVVLFTTGVIVALFFGSFVKSYYPDFSSLLFVSALVFFGGIAYAIAERNIAIGILTIFLTLLIPFIKKMLTHYWDWVGFQFHAFFR